MTTLKFVHPHVSIIIATYNCAGIIEKTIQSVIEQNFTEKELIIIDGGSTDTTLDILKRYDEAIDCLISEPDRGIYDAFNKGISKARGKWLYFLGSDDQLFDKNVLKKVFSVSPQGKIIYGNVLLDESDEEGKKGKFYDGRFSTFKLCLRNICQQAIFYHRSLFSRFGAFELKYPVLADYAFNLKVFAEEDTRPQFIDMAIAVFCNKGVSGRKIDAAFERDRGTLIRGFYGLPHYLLFRIVKSAIRSIVRLSTTLGLKTKWRSKQH